MTTQQENAGAVSLLFRLWSRVYDNPLPQRLFYRRVHRRMVDRWRPRSGERVVDVGCGTGLFLKSLAADHDGLELTGLDLSEHMLAQARRDARPARSPAPVFVQGSVYDLPFADGAFDVALNSISCHFYLEQVRAFREIRRVLVPGGRLVCAALTAGLRGRASLAGMAVYHPVPVLTEHFVQAGFEVTACERMFPFVAVFEVRRPPTLTGGRGTGVLAG
jgi:ubiquinone/menaquinone biosynthesis C-methylase UbiE